MTFTWIRRTRIDGDSWVGEVPLGEDSEQYAVDILSGSTVVRTLNATTPTALYAAADELADFGAAQTSLQRARDAAFGDRRPRLRGGRNPHTLEGQP